MFVVILFVCLYLAKSRRDSERDDGVTRLYQFNSRFDNLKKSETIASPFIEVAEAHDIPTAKTFGEASYILFNDYTNIDQSLHKVPFVQNKKYLISGMTGVDKLCSKSALAYFFKKHGLASYVPKSYILENDDDMREFAENHGDKIYIIKKNIQRQTGTKITKDYEYILNNAKNDEYVVVQELLQNPFLVNGRKINIRVYLVAVRINDNIEFYYYHDGFMYYTKAPFKKNSLSDEHNITTGYIDRQVYSENPLTIRDLYEFIGKEKSHVLQKNIHELFVNLKKIYAPILLEENKRFPGIMYNIFGVDVAPDEKLGVTCMESNKGPSLVYMDDKDKAVKYNLIKDVMTLTGTIVSGDVNNFIKV